MEKIVEMRAVRAWRGSTLVFQDLSLEIPVGCSTAILGPNGAGKSTLLRLLTRESHPEHRPEPSMRLFGKDRWDVWDLRRRLGIVSHDLQLDIPPYATGLDVALSGYYSSRGIWPHQRFSDDERRRAEATLERLGVGSLRCRRYDVMSTGEQRRVLLARALVHDPDVLVLDEPTSGLDPSACFQYIRIVRDLIRSGKTVILVTHHIHEIPPEIERTVLLKEGRVFADGPTAEVLDSDRLSRLFGARLELVRANGFFQVVPGPE
jgi:iron complex transport system ATP-binding protein